MKIYFVDMDSFNFQNYHINNLRVICTLLFLKYLIIVEK